LIRRSNLLCVAGDVDPRHTAPCKERGCSEEVVFSFWPSLAHGQDPMKYRGRCPEGHPNVLTPHNGRQWVEADRRTSWRRDQ
jgi:hypothetical protein